MELRMKKFLARTCTANEGGAFACSACGTGGLYWLFEGKLCGDCWKVSSTQSQSRLRGRSTFDQSAQSQSLQQSTLQKIFLLGLTRRAMAAQFGLSPDIFGRWLRGELGPEGQSRINKKIMSKETA